MKKQITDIQLAFPCTQQWEDMTICSNGRFCSGCQKTVFDFTSKNQEEYVFLYAKMKGQLCGRFTLSQLKTSNSFGKIAFIAGMLLATELDAQTNNLSKLPSTPIDTTKSSIHEEVFIGIIIEQQPEFEGGFNALHKFISDNLRCPDQNCVTGTVYVGFIIDYVGNVKNVEVKRGIKGQPKYDEEAIRVIKLTSGKWKSGLTMGKPIETRYTMPIKFKLD